MCSRPHPMRRIDDHWDVFREHVANSVAINAWYFQVSMGEGKTLPNW
jgi:hypothetical protein